MLMKCQYTAPDLDVDLYPHLLNAETANAWYTYLDELFPQENRRTSLLFGDEGLIYRVNYQEVTRESEVIPWNALPALTELKNLVEKVTNQTYTVCAIQCYPNGKVGINPHRDKEMVAGTQIAGLSLGAKRTISFTRNYHDPISIALLSGSLYVMKNMTNQKWLHSIVKDAKVREPRFSLTFRNYRE